MTQLITSYFYTYNEWKVASRFDREGRLEVHLPAVEVLGEIETCI
ncbi:hypothetical protein [Cytobacillus praedii]|nr:hypothetical protein [Cytobacillus praedii]